MSHVPQGKHAQKFSLQVFLCKSFHSMFHIYGLVHILSMELVPSKLFNMLAILKIFHRMFEMVRECTHTKRDLVCSMIMISENATPKTILVMVPQCSCEKQEYQDFIPKQW